MDADRTTVVFMRGTPVSPGLARGPLVVLRDDASQTPRRDSVDANAESQRLRGAIAAAGGELSGLIERATDAEAQTIVAFQVAMLADRVVTDPAYAAIAAGIDAGHAWRAAMDVQIREFHDADDLYFRARASDLRDMRDRVLRHLAGASATAIPPGSIVVAADMPPSRFLETAWDGGGLALTHGSANSHVAMLARAQGVPMLIGVEAADVRDRVDAIIDADNGMLVVSPDDATAESFASRQRRAELARVEAERFANAPAVTADGERVLVLLNVADARELDRLDSTWCDGIGLVRTELMLRDVADLGDEEKQYDAYARIVRWAGGRPVTVRTVDAGGDKPIPGYTVDGETNPFLGLRGVRLSLRHPQLLATQLRALARAASLGPLAVILPMVTSPREVDRVRALLDASLAELRTRGADHARPALGIMVEVPAAALAIDLFDVDFISIGSNDLVQYVTGTSRDARDAALQDPLQPAVLRLIHAIVGHADRRRIAVGLCGDMAADARCIPALLDVGLRRLSVAPSALARVKAAIARHRVKRHAEPAA